MIVASDHDSLMIDDVVSAMMTMKAIKLSLSLS